MPDPEVLNKMLLRATQRRSSDGEIDQTITHNVAPGGIAYPNYRSQAMITYAYSIETKCFYVGYSGSASGMTDKHGDLANHDMAWRRYERIKGEIEWYSEQYTGSRSPYNCGEAAAYAIAASWKENLSKLAFASFGLKNQLVNPCENCRIWLEGAYGYYWQPASGHFQEPHFASPQWYEPKRSS